MYYWVPFAGTATITEEHLENDDAGREAILPWSAMFIVQTADPSACYFGGQHIDSRAGKFASPPRGARSRFQPSLPVVRARKTVSSQRRSGI
jgi:hypothetical protein